MGKLARGAFHVLLCAVGLGGGVAAAELSGDEPRAVPAQRVVLETVQVTMASRPETPEQAPASPDMVFDPAEVRSHDASLQGMRNGVAISGHTPHRMILFTFDDGPNRLTTPRLLRALDETGVKAVFFVTTQRISGPGPRQAAQAAILRDIVRRGHFVGNHSVNHRQLPRLDSESVLREVQGAEEAIERVVGLRPWLIRPPYGGRSNRVDRIIASRGYTQMLWNLGTGDFQVRDADIVVETFRRVLERREREDETRGGIVLLHDTHPWSVDAFPRIVSYLRERNCELLEEGEELFDIVDDPSLFFIRERGPDEASAEGETSRVDPAIIARRQERLREETSRRCNAVAEL